jgi:dynein assembly factor 1
MVSLAIDNGEAEDAGGPRLTPAFLAAQCKKHSGYRTPELNTTLYLHRLGLTRIEGLEPYTGLRVLWLEGNALHDLSGLAQCTELRALYLHHNAIDHIGDGKWPLPAV